MAKKFLDDENLRNRLLDLIRLGHGRHDACRAVGISPQTFRQYWKFSEEFRDEVDDAFNASTEPVLATLRELATEGDVTAAKEYLRHMAPPPRSEADKGKSETKVDLVVQHQLDPADVQAIHELEALVQRRKALEAGEVVDAEVLDD